MVSFILLLNFNRIDLIARLQIQYRHLLQPVVPSMTPRPTFNAFLYLD